MNCLDIDALQGLGDFTPMQRWIQRVQQVAAANRKDAHKVVAASIHIPVKEARDVTRLTQMDVRPSPADVASAAGTAKVAATAKMAQAAAAFHKTNGDTLEAQIRKLLDAEEKAAGDAKVNLRTQIAKLACDLATERVNASRNAVVGGALRAAVSLHNKAMRAPDPATKVAKLQQATNAVAVASTVAQTPVKLGLPIFMANAGRPTFVAQALESSSAFPALHGLGGIADDFHSAVLSFVKKVRNPIPTKPLIAGAVQKAEAVQNAGIPVPTNSGVVPPSVFVAVAKAASRPAPQPTSRPAPPVFAPSRTHQAVPVFPGQVTSTHQAVPVNTGIRPPVRTHQAVPVQQHPTTTHSAVPVGLHGLGDTLVKGTVVMPSVDFGPVMPHFSSPYGVPQPTPLPFTPQSQAVAKEIDSQVPAATPSGMESPTKSGWSAWVLPSLVVAGGLVLHVAL